MRQIMVVLGLGVMVATGCAQHNQSDADLNGSANSQVLDVSPPPVRETQPTAYTAPVEPTPAPAPAVSTTPVAEPAAPAPTGTTYTVKKGDTLYGIARAHYGDAKQWKRIAEANPGVNPQALKVGQVLHLP